MKTGQGIIYRIIGGAGGLLLAVANLWPLWAPVQLLAFGMIFYLGLKDKAGYKGMLAAGFYMGLGYSLPQMIALRMHIVVTVILLVYLVIVMMALAWGGAYLIRGRLNIILTRLRLLVNGVWVFLE